MNIKGSENFSPSWWFYDVNEQLRRYIYKCSEEAFAKGDADRDAINNIHELEIHRTYMRNQFIEAMGGLPSGDTPLNPRIVGSVNCKGFKVEKVIYESRPKVYVTSNLYIPDGVTAPRGAVLFVCGHHQQAKQQDNYQIVCQYLALAGLVVLAIDPVGQGERFSYYERSIGSALVNAGTSEHEYAGNQCLPVGDALARYFILDDMRGIDYLCTRPEVDPLKIGVTGSSGGGLQTGMLMVCDPRIAAAAPATFITSRQSILYTGNGQDAEQVWPGMSALGFDHEDILLMMAPRPVLILSVKYDFFPIEGTRRTFSRACRFWEMYGRRENLEMFEDCSEHMYTRSLAKTAAEFFTLHLLGKKVSPQDDKIREIAPSSLWCTKSGQVMGEIDNARFVFDENRDRLVEAKKTRDSMPEKERKDKAIAWLREKVFSNRRTFELNPRNYYSDQSSGLTFKGKIWWAQEGIFNNAVLFKDYRFEGRKLPVTIAVWDGGTSLIQSHNDWIRDICSSGRAVMVLDVSGIGALKPYYNGYKEPMDPEVGYHKLIDDLVFLNDSIAAMRIFDVTRAIDVLEQLAEVEKDGVRLYAHGRQGLYAQMAALLDDRVQGIDVVDGMKSYESWVGSRYYNEYDVMGIVIPGMLKYLDIPDVVRWTEEKVMQKRIFGSEVVKKY